MSNTPIAMIQKFIQRWFCDRFAPLLTAYVEGGLNEKERIKVAAHIKTCSACRLEVEELTELGKLLRAHPPAVPQLKPDLWSRIQAEITAEATVEPERPVVRPIPQRQPSPQFRWASFGLSFATTGTLVAAAVVGVVVLTRPLLHPQMDVTLPAKPTATAIAAATEDRTSITMEFRDALKPEIAKSHSEPKPKTAVTSPARIATTEIRPAQPARVSQMALVRRRDRWSSRSETVAVARQPRPIAAPPKSYVAVTLAEKTASDKLLLAEPSSLEAPSQKTENSVSKVAEKPVDVAMATRESLGTENNDEVVAPREVPAAGFVNDAAKFRARQILFVYSGR